MKLEGAMTALVTPMRSESVDYDALGTLVEAQLAAGIDALVAVGTTGESATLDMEEHTEVIRFVVKAAAGRVPVIAGAGGNATAEALSLTRASEAAGADALLQVVPYYNKPTQEGMFRHFSAIAGATELPIVLYNVPGRTVSDLLPETVARLAEIDNVVAIKEATGSVVRATEIIELCGDAIAVLSGDDFTSFPLYSVGSRGVISVVSNVMPDAMAEMWDAVVAGDWAQARALHYKIQPMTRLLFAESNPVPAKTALALLGMMQPDARLPLAPCTDELRERLRAQLNTEGML
ncbi:4-hydroxy-tetrahydrodipicolinate synthase [Haliangium ochraceum]|uniref:4-hydroxy-tetrahydrodipicolinate synthase n=1 Tax=Haliangium ochraceum (strain DSM 14365 / JCM 11303 / SMP-2) TaxID=502025 RepID=D0LJC8_HALO1|nr:dihydrodipicolinate synthase [Haliangium ochraceum DSM 14365]